MNFLRKLFAFESSENTCMESSSMDELFPRQDSQTSLRNHMNNFQYSTGAYTRDYRELFKHNYDTVLEHYYEIDGFIAAGVVDDIQSVLKLLIKSRSNISNCMELMDIQEDVLMKQQEEITRYSERVEIEREKCKNKESHISVLTYEKENLIEILENQTEYYITKPSHIRTISKLDEEISQMSSDIEQYSYLLSLRSDEYNQLKIDFCASEHAMKEIIRKKTDEVEILTCELENTKSRLDWQKKSSEAQITELEEMKYAKERSFVDRLKEMNNEIEALNVELEETKSKLVLQQTSEIGKINELDEDKYELEHSTNEAVQRLNNENEELKTELKHMRSEIDRTRNCLKNLRSVNKRVLEKIKLVNCDAVIFKNAVKDLEIGNMTDDDDAVISKCDESVRETNQLVAQKSNFICTSTECEEKQSEADKCIVKMVGRYQKLKQENADLKSKIKRFQTSSKSVEISSHTISRSTISGKSESSTSVSRQHATRWNSRVSDKTSRDSSNSISGTTVQRHDFISDSNDTNSDAFTGFSEKEKSEEPHSNNISDENDSCSTETNGTINDCSVTTFLKNEKSEKYVRESISDSKGSCLVDIQVSSIESHFQITNEPSDTESLRNEFTLKVTEYNNMSEEFKEMISNKSKEIELKQNEVTNNYSFDYTQKLSDKQLEELIAKYCNPRRKEILDSETELEGDQRNTLQSNVNKTIDVDEKDSNTLSDESKSLKSTISISGVETEFEQNKSVPNYLFDYSDQEANMLLYYNPLQEKIFESKINLESDQNVTSQSDTNEVAVDVDKKDLKSLSVESELSELKMSESEVETEFERNKAVSDHALDCLNQQSDEEIKMLTDTNYNSQQEEIPESNIKLEGVQKITSQSNTIEVTVDVDQKDLKLSSVESKIPELNIVCDELISPHVESKYNGNVQNVKKTNFLLPRISKQSNISTTKSKCKIKYHMENQSADVTHKMMTDLFKNMKKEMTVQTKKDYMNQKQKEWLLNPTNFNKCIYETDEWRKRR